MIIFNNIKSSGLALFQTTAQKNLISTDHLQSFLNDLTFLFNSLCFFNHQIFDLLNSLPQELYLLFKSLENKEFGAMLSKADLSIRNRLQIQLIREFGIERNNPEVIKLFTERFPRAFDGFDFEWLRRELRPYYQ